MSFFVASAGLSLLLLLGYLIVVKLRHRDEQPLAAYLIFVVVFSATACSVLLSLINLSVLWPEAAATSFVLSANGIVFLSVVPAFLLGIWLSSRRPYASPSIGD